MNRVLLPQFPHANKLSDFVCLCSEEMYLVNLIIQINPGSVRFFFSQLTSSTKGLCKVTEIKIYYIFITSCKIKRFCIWKCTVNVLRCPKDADTECLESSKQSSSLSKESSVQRPREKRPFNTATLPTLHGGWTNSSSCQAGPVAGRQPGSSWAGTDCQGRLNCGKRDSDHVFFLDPKGVLRCKVEGRKVRQQCPW